MAKFCKNCGTELADNAKFCNNCGEKITDEQQPAQQTREQPAQPVQSAQPVYQPQYTPNYVSAQVKKKSGIPIVAVIIIIVAVIIVAIIGAVIAVAFSALNNTANLDYYTIGKDQIPSVKYVLGEKRDVIGVNNSISNGVDLQIIEYKTTDGNQNSEMLQYALALMNNYGFINSTDYNFSNATGSGFQFAKESAESGKIIILQIDYDQNGYTITIQRGAGSLTYNGE